jgi:hypothetical protein
MNNAYPELPELQYRKTSIEMALVIAHIKVAAVPVEVKRAAYIFFRIESGNGRSGINNNYAGTQADGARWPDEYESKIAGTCVKNENGTGKPRRFVCFHSWKDSLDFTITNAQRRGMFVGGKTWKYTSINVKTSADLCRAYKREWVTGEPKYKPSEKELQDFDSMYQQAVKIFA